MSNPSLTEDLLNLLVDVKPALSLPAWTQLDCLPKSGDGISLQMAKTPKTQKTYITGKTIKQASFEVLAKTTESKNTSLPNLTATGWLEAIGALFAGMNKFALSASRTITKGEHTSPSIVSRDDDSQVTYSLAVEIVYTEE